MFVVPNNDFRAPFHVMALGAVAAATISVFFGIGFLWLAPPKPTLPSVFPDLPAQALEEHEVPPTNHTMPGSSSAAPADNIAEQAASGAPSDQKMATAGSIAIATAITTSARIIHRKRVTARRHYRGKITVRNPVVSQSVHAYPGPNPGGGFYGPPNVNVGYITPR
jgi:hypothetical protein